MTPCFVRIFTDGQKQKRRMPLDKSSYLQTNALGLGMVPYNKGSRSVEQFFPKMHDTLSVAFKSTDLAWPLNGRAPERGEVSFASHFKTPQTNE